MRSLASPCLSKYSTRSSASESFNSYSPARFCCSSFSRCWRICTPSPVQPIISNRTHRHKWQSNNPFLIQTAKVLPFLLNLKIDRVFLRFLSLYIQNECCIIIPDRKWIPFPLLLPDMLFARSNRQAAQYLFHISVSTINILTV